MDGGINHRFLDSYLKEMHYLMKCEIDQYAPSTFFHIVRALEPMTDI